jgi:hypothetical protein
MRILESPRLRLAINELLDACDRLVGISAFWPNQNGQARSVDYSEWRRLSSVVVCLLAVLGPHSHACDGELHKRGRQVNLESLGGADADAKRIAAWTDRCALSLGRSVVVLSLR